MPLIKSAKKRVRTARKATVRNAKTKRSLRVAIKGFGKKPSATSHAAAQSTVSKAAKKRVIHKNKAARTQRQLARTAKANGTKVAGTGKKAATKPVVKKTVVKKPITKKAPAKKK